MQANKSAICEL